MNHPEQKFHFAVADFLNAVLPRNAWWSSIGHGGFALDARTGARMKRAGVKAGVPDILIVYDGRAHFLELKAGKGRPSPAQVAVFEALAAAGCVTHGIARSLDDVAYALHVWGVPLRAAVGGRVG